jgi:hypothetical protein
MWRIQREYATNMRGQICHKYAGAIRGNMAYIDKCAQMAIKSLTHGRKER